MILMRKLIWKVGHEYRRGDFTLFVRVWEPWYVNGLGTPTVQARYAEQHGLVAPR